MNTATMTGAKVGAGRFPAMGGGLPGLPGRPWSGVVLDRADPLAWEGTIAFGSRKPTRKECAEHLASVGGIPSHVPVLWDFGASGPKVYWERVDSLRPYAEELAEWQATRHQEPALA